MNVATRAHQVVVEGMAQFAESATGGFAETIGGATAVVTGLQIAAFNSVSVTGDASENDLRLAMMVAAGTGLPWSVLLREGIDDGYLEMVRTAGLVAGESPVPLMATTDPAPRDWPSELVLVDGAWTVAMHRALVADAFDMDPPTVGALVTHELAAHPQVRIVAGTLDGLPVTTAMAVEIEDAVAIFNVATTADVRGRGFGSAITWAAMQPAFDSGATLAALQTSKLGHGVYEGLGYEVVAQHRHWVSGE